MTSNIKFRAEFKPLLSVANILLEFPRPVILESPRINIEADSVSVQTEELTVVYYLEGLTLKPHTCRGLRWNSQQELQLSLQAESNTSENKNGNADGIKAHNHHHFCNQEVLVSKIKTCQSRCYCAGCGAHILKSSCNFQRVLPLPSENWTDFADIWFCHNHQSDGKTHDHSHHDHSGDSTLPGQLKNVKDSGLSPRPEDCLVSSLYMLVSARQVKSCAVLCTTDRIICKRCGNFLGFVKLRDADSGDHNLHSYFHDPLNGVYKLYFHAVSFGGNLEELSVHRLKVPQELDSQQIIGNNHDQSVEAFICHLLKDQSHLYTSFRFIIDSSCQRGGQSGVLILVLWMLQDQISRSGMLVKMISAIKLCLSICLDLSEKWILWLLDQELDVFFQSLTLSVESSSSAADELPQQNHVSSWKLVSCKYMKLLYKATFLHLNEAQSGKSIPPPVFTAWQKDNTVHGISLPYPLCKQLISLLVSSTKQLTRSQRSLNGFHVGYLQVS